MNLTNVSGMQGSSSMITRSRHRTRPKLSLRLGGLALVTLLSCTSCSSTLQSTGASISLNMLDSCGSGAYRHESGNRPGCPGFSSCPPGSSCVNGTRLLCPPGTFSDGQGTGSCTGSCAAGTAAARCVLLPRSCRSRITFRPPRTHLLLILSPLGFFCPEGSASATQASCGGPDVYCPAGSASPTPATEGFYTTGGDSPQTRTSQALCPIGHYCQQGTKQPCPGGTYGTSEGLATAECSGVCPAGFYCPAGSTSPTAYLCGAGPQVGGLMIGLERMPCTCH